MKTSAQCSECITVEIPVTIPRRFSFTSRAESAVARLTPAAQLRRARLEGIQSAKAENTVWLWIAASAAGVLAMSLWF